MKTPNKKNPSSKAVHVDVFKNSRPDAPDQLYLGTAGAGRPAGRRNQPLSVELLKAINNDMYPRRWVWVENLANPEHENIPSAYYQVHSDHSKGKSFCCGYPGYGVHFDYSSYGKDWVAYWQQPTATELPAGPELDVLREWRLKADAMERAIRAFETAHGFFSFACFSCAFQDEDQAHACVLLGDEVCEDMENWQFDPDRFPEK